VKIAQQKRSFLSWTGGKSRLAKTIIPLLPEHRCYCEVFAGAGWLLFKKEPSEAELLNDINSELVTLYRVVKLHLDEFIRFFRWILVARDEFQRFLAESPETLTDIQRAVRFYYLVKTSHGSHVASPTFGSATTRPPRLNLLRIEEELSAAHLRLAQVTVENLPYARFIERYDRRHTLFYGCENYYGEGLFSREDFVRLRDQLAGIEGKFLMSINDAPEIRELFDKFDIMEVPTTYSVGARGHQKPVTELVIGNYDLPRT
jgi:DNA adenine methylase